MTTTFRSPKSRLRASTVFLFGVSVFLVVGTAVFHQTLFSFLSSIPASLTATTPDVYAGLPKNVLASRLADREEELTRIKYQSLLYSALAEENERLRELLALPGEERRAVGRVIARPPRTHYDTLLIELGEGNHVRPGDFASFENALLGTVEEVGERTALVKLYSSGGASVDARAGDPSGIVVLKGLGGGAFVFEVPQPISIDPGDVLVSAHDGTSMLAVVESVVSDPNTTLKTVYAKFPSSFSDIRFVTFVRNISDEL